ncbi:uncharacterized protein BDW43DRAFT_311663 [Aspergillus alliaceus]|uniref:uncharacterized protein n=1 Tax=Petromyces alliaceus TaxID=209559 RepID=UPI0012A4BF6B|nr:uncharacterized protein BDW43DRAFT_311663 [Aspergillus alliaceus]KAB8232922.1 hypothetical protein BDW43DRAFT_311663 [Aspergillus alliaceus]
MRLAVITNISQTMSVPFIGLFATFTLFGTHFKIPGLKELCDQQKSLVALYPVCYEEDKPTWWDNDDDNNEDSSTIPPYSPPFRYLIDVVSILSGLCAAIVPLRSAKPRKSDESDADSILPEVDKAILRQGRERVCGLRSSNRIPEYSLAQHALGHLPEWEWSLAPYRPGNQPSGQIVRVLVAIPPAPAPTPEPTPEPRRKKRNRPSQAKRLRYARRLQAEEEWRQAHDKEDPGELEPRAEQTAEQQPPPPPQQPADVPNQLILL